MTKIVCNACHSVYPSDCTPFRCECGGTYDFVEFPQFDQSQVGNRGGVERFFPLLGLDQNYPLISLGEGETPLLPTLIDHREVFLKMESLNPTGSYKDRGTSVLVSFLKSRGVRSAVEDSSGNAGASFAAYCARAGISARVFVPESASGPKRAQIEAYGAELVRIPGPRQAAANAVMQAVIGGAVYGSHAWMPFGMTGIATIAYEIVEQLGGVPGTVVAPIGHGGLLYGIVRGFEAMAETGYIPQEPYYLGVQSWGCAPLEEAFKQNSLVIPEVKSSETAAEGVKVLQPVRGEVILKKMLRGRGKIISIDENSIVTAWQQSSRQGFHVEPTSALAWAALMKGSADFKAPIVTVMTGSGLKSSI